MEIKKKDYRKKWAKENPQKIKEYARKDYLKHREAYIKRSKKHYRENRESALLKCREYQEKNKEKIKKMKRVYYLRTRLVRIARVKEAKERNKDYYRKWQQKYDRERRKVDSQYKISKLLRTRLGHALRGNFKTGSAIRDLGCSLLEFKKYLENQFINGMSWENQGKNGWHIDHKIPLSKFDLTNREELLRACHFTNLQPLWEKDNLSKGNNI